MKLLGPLIVLVILALPVAALILLCIRPRRGWGWAVLCLLGCGVMLFLIPVYVGTMETPTRTRGLGLFGLLSICAVGFAMASLGAFQKIKRMRAKPSWACPKCGYDLRGCARGICPECGENSRPKPLGPNTD